MKTLFLVRHAKAEKNLPGQSDFERPLAKRGLADAADMAARLKAKGILPQCLVSSPANRAKSTALIFADILGYGFQQMVYEQDIYDAWTEDLLKVIRRTENDPESLMLFGHNPGFTGLADLLSLHDGVEHLPTAGVAQLIFPDLQNWKSLQPGTGKLILDFPKNPEY